MQRPPPFSPLFPYTTLFRSTVMPALAAVPLTAHFGWPSALGVWSLTAAVAAAIWIVVLLQKNEDRKSTRLNSSHVRISYAVFCLKKKKKLANLRSQTGLTLY